MNRYRLVVVIYFFGNLFFITSSLAQGILADSTFIPASKKLLSVEIKNTARYLKPPALIIPGTLLLYGCLKPAVKGIQNLDDNLRSAVLMKYPNFNSNAADYLMWAPSVALYTIKALNGPTKHSFREQLVIEAGSIVITGGVGMVMRKISGNMEVYNKEGTKFPSGHTANAFRGAEIFHQELKDSHTLLSYAGYIVAAGVGTLRIVNKNHLLSEVLAGAGLGILSTKLTYWIFERIKRQHFPKN